MAEIKRSVLFGKLNSVSYKTIESATVFCKMRGNPVIELVHWVQQVLQEPDTDISKILDHFDVDRSRLAGDVTSALDRLPSGASSISSLSFHYDDLLESAWSYTSLMFGEAKIRTGHLMVALVKSRGLANVLAGISGEFARIKAEPLTDDFASVVKGSGEVSETLGSGITQAHEPGVESGAVPPAQMGKQEALARFSVDLTEKASKGDMDPILGRDDEIRQIVDILMRRKQNNPILTGEAGVGKTAVAEGFAQKIAEGDVPDSLKNVTVRILDVGLLQAGASMKGEFENRLRQVIEEVQCSPSPIILFIDEAHTLIGAGGAAGTGDAANLLKPALARGTLRTIAATTWAEYKKYFEKDPALTRRFQVVKIEEPSEENAVVMLRGIASALEKHHGVSVLGEALESAVSLSHRYIPGRMLPDKAVSLLDTACARVAVSQNSIPAKVADNRRRIENLETELSIIGRDERSGFDVEKQKVKCEEALALARESLEPLETTWEEELDLVNRILDLRKKLRDAGEDPDSAVSGEGVEDVSGELSVDDLKQELSSLTEELREKQGDSPLVLNCVDATAVGSVVADWTGIPVGGMVKDEIAAVLGLTDTLEKRVIGQRHALDAITKRIQTSRAGVDHPGKPVGVFLLAGPSGVGKTETALALAEAMFGGEQNLITINMSEFQEAHTVSTLKGAPPGYVGYGEGGVLTEAVRRRPYSVILLDEVEKAHPDVHEIFFQVFDKGVMEDGEGRVIDFKNTIILLTSNVGSELIMNMCSKGNAEDPEAIAKALRPDLLKVFPAALLGRLITVPYYPISDEMLDVIIRLQLGRIKERLRQNRDVAFEYDDSVVSVIKSRSTELESGARMVDAILTNTLLPEISRAFLTRMVEGEEVTQVMVSALDEEFTYDIR